MSIESGTQSNTKTAPKSVLLFSPSGTWDQYPDFLNTLYRRHGTRFTVIVPHTSRIAEARAWGPMIDEVLSASDMEDEFAARSNRLSEDTIYQRSFDLEDKYKINILRDYVMTNRRMAAPALGMADTSPVGRLKPPPLSESHALINETFAYFEELFSRKHFDLVVARTEGFFENTAVYVARNLRIPTTFPIFTRQGNRFMWTSNPFIGHDFLKRKYDALPKADMSLIDDTAPPPVTHRNRQRALQLRSTWLLMRKVAVEIVVHTIMALRSLKQRGSSKRLSLLSVLQRSFAAWRMFRYIDRNGDKDIDRVTERPFILFLLQVEPEWTTLSQAKEFNNTLALIQQLSSKLPAGHRLVVKEHTTNIGNRGKDFYEKIRRLPTVVFAHYSISGIELAKRSAAVVTISGTIGMEAGLIGKRALLFAKRSEYVFLPHVTLISDFMNITPTLREAVRPLNAEETRNIQEGAARYRAAVNAASWDASNGLLFGGTGGLSPEEAGRAGDLLLEVIELQHQRYAAGLSFD